MKLIALHWMFLKILETIKAATFCHWNTNGATSPGLIHESSRNKNHSFLHACLSIHRTCGVKDSPRSNLRNDTLHITSSRQLFFHIGKRSLPPHTLFFPIGMNLSAWKWLHTAPSFCCCIQQYSTRKLAHTHCAHSKK